MQCSQQSITKDFACLIQADRLHGSAYKGGAGLGTGVCGCLPGRGAAGRTYFSIIDWHHPDFPKYGDRQHPMRNNESYKDEKIDFDRYLDYMHAQVKELVTNYGKLDLLWFDFSYDDMCGEKWRASSLSVWCANISRT